MICPTCKNPMFVVEYKKVELDYCGNCHGVWFDAGELDILLEAVKVDGSRRVLDDLLKADEPGTKEKKRKCPICRRGMRKVNIAGASQVLIDTCVKGDGLWFDGGEVDHLIKYLEETAPDKPDRGKVFSFIKEVFKS